MAAYRIGEEVGLNTQNWVGLTADTSAFLAANTTFANGSTYLEIDGAERKYMLLNGTWYEQSGNSAAELISLGQNGGKAITGTDATTPDSGYYFALIEVIADTVFAAQGNVSGVTNIDLTAFSFVPAGTILGGAWNSITLTSGEIAVYNGVA